MTNYGSKAMRNRLLAGSLLASACFGLTFTGPAYAQATSPTDQETEQEQVLVVTGSRINNPNLVQATQIQVVSEEEILLQQANTVEELLRQLPGAVPNIGPAVNNGTNGNAEFDLRGLGSNRNLILIGGQRVVPAGLTSAVNTDIIPLALVQRADVVTGGASSTYGADAISGVVNFILKDDFVGLELQTSYRFTQRVDGETFRADLLWGTNFDNDRGNVAV